MDVPDIQKTTDAPAKPVPELSVVVPVLNEADNIAPLIDDIRTALDGKCDYEIVYVDDGSSDATIDNLVAAASRCPRIRIIRHNSRYGQSAAIFSGVRAARAPIIATLDGDGQNDPNDIVKLLAVRDNTEPEKRERLLVAGHRAKRRDNRMKRISSKIANRVRAAMLGDDTPDTGCGLKLFSRDTFLEMPHFDHMHRFLPALVIRSGGTVVSIAVNHRARQRGISNYGMWDRLWIGIVDLFGVMWLQRRPCRPLLVDDTKQDPQD